VHEPEPISEDGKLADISGQQSALHMDDTRTAASGAKPELRFGSIEREISLGVGMSAFIESSRSDKAKYEKMTGG
jgi:hypothetical protein